MSPFALASKVGETYQQVITEKGEPRSRMVDGASAILMYPDVTIELTSNVVVAVEPNGPKLKPSSSPSTLEKPKPSGVPARADSTTQQKREANDAIAAVKRIVNQPVPSIARTPQMKVALCPDWFHVATTTPDFNSVDIRRTQQPDYDRYPYVALASNSGAVTLARNGSSTR